VVPELNDLTNEQLEELLNNDSRFEEFLLGLERYKNSEAAADELREEIERRAKLNLEKEPRLKVLKESLEAQQVDLAKEREVFERNIHSLNEEMKVFFRFRKSVLNMKSIINHPLKILPLAQKLSPQVIIGKLSSATKNAEGESEEIVEKFNSGELDASQFVKSFIEKKKIHHKRAAKLEMVKADPSILSKSS